MKNLLLIPVVILAGSCASQFERGRPTPLMAPLKFELLVVDSEKDKEFKTPLMAPLKFELLVVDSEKDKEFKIEFRSHDSRDLCFEVEQWPSTRGSLDSGSQVAQISSVDRVIPAFDDNFGYCPGGCGLIKVEPGKSLLGRISYSQFGDPEEIAQLRDKNLLFGVKPKLCGPKMNIVDPR